MKIFVTGIAGFLGSHIAERMLNAGHQVRGIDNMIGGDTDNIPFWAGARYRKIDCNDISQLRGFMKGSDIIFHCAATAYEGLSVFSPHFVIQNIVGASTAVFSAAIANGVKRIVHCSSMARYGSIGELYTEDQQCAPQDPYGIGKLAVERILRNLCDTHGVEYTIAVPHNIIGPRQKYDDPFRNVASIMINLMLQDRAPIIYGDGNQERCFSYITDCLSCLEMMAFDPAVVGEVINIGPDEEVVTINELCRIIAGITGFRGVPTYMPGRPQEVKHAVCSSAKARRMLGYQTTVTLRDGLKLMADDIRRKGVKPFDYHIDLEIVNELTPQTWLNRLF